MSDLEKIRKAAIARRNYDKRNGVYPINRIKPRNIDPDQLEAYRAEYYHPTTRKAGAPATGIIKTALNVSVSIKTLEKARELGVNLSAACEEGLIMAITQKLQSTHNP
jgi:hypothetical protein